MYMCIFVSIISMKIERAKHLILLQVLACGES